MHSTCVCPLASTNLAPPFCADVRAPTDANAPRALVAAGAPRPASASSNWQVIPAEGEPGAGDADEGAKQHVEAEVAEVGEACAGNVDGGADGDEYEDERVDGWCSVLVADGDYGVFGVGSWRGEGCVLLLHGESGLFLEVRGSHGGGPGGICGERAVREEGYCDGEFGGEEEGEVEEAGP